MKPRSLAFKSYRLLRTVVGATGLFGTVRRLMGPVLGPLLFKLSADGSGPKQILGHTMILAPPGRFPPMDMAMGAFEPGTTRLFESLLQPGKVVLDIGAHVGYYALLAARQTGPTGKVYAFEPEPSNYALLVQNIAANGYQNVVPIERIVSNRMGSSTLFLSALDNGRNSTYQHGLPEKGSVQVESTTVDAFLEEVGNPRVDLIKIDVEGAEPEVLDGMQRLLTRSDHLDLIIEFNPRLLKSAGAGALEFPGQLASYGFSVHCINEKNGPALLDIAVGHSWAKTLLDSSGTVNLFCSKSGAGLGR